MRMRLCGLVKPGGLLEIASKEARWFASNVDLLAWAVMDTRARDFSALALVKHGAQW